MYKPHRNPLTVLRHAGLALRRFVACKPATTPPPGTDLAPPPSDTPVVAAPVSWPDEPFLGPGAGAPGDRRASLPGVETFKLSNGLEVYLVQQNKLPTVTMAFEFDFGGISDPKNQVGLHAICMDLLDEGTQKYDTAAFEEKQADHAVNVSSSGGAESLEHPRQRADDPAGAGARPAGGDDADAGHTKPTSTASRSGARPRCCRPRPARARSPGACSGR